MNSKKFILGILVASVLGGAIALGGYRVFFNQEKEYETLENERRVHLSNYLENAELEIPEGLNFVMAAEYTMPTVVHVRTYYEKRVTASPYDDMFEEFFGPRFKFEDRGGNDGQQAQGSGSGVIISEDGYIATNNHVIDNADKIEVTLDDKRKYTATLIGRDPTTDLALLKIEAEEKLPFVKYGNSDDVKIGEWVLAVGNPFNLTSTVTAGIVSAKGRNINILRDNYAIESFIQTDAAVNPGNSGGALVNLRGELVGINTAIASPTGSYSGYSFAVPVTIVKKVMDDLLEYGQVQRALLGVSIADVNANLAEEKGLDEVRGVYIMAVSEGSAAKEAGIKEGDVIIKVDDVEVNSPSELQEQIARNRPGDEVTLVFLRDGKVKTATAELKNKMGNTEVVKREDSKVLKSLGVDLREITREEKEKLEINGGVKVISVQPGKLQQVGVEPGFVITAIDKQRTHSVAEVIRILEKKEEGADVMTIEGVYPDGSKGIFGIGW